METVGKPLGLDAEDAAAAILTVADNQMANAARMVSIEKGHDPREFVLFAFGGAGPMHAAAIARELGIPKVLVPRFPGITSALGCVLADVRHDYVRSLHRPLADVDPELGQSVLDEQAAAGRALIDSEGVAVTAVDVVHEADMLYRGQSHVFRIPVAGPGFDPERIRATFAERYQHRFDIALPEMVPMLVKSPHHRDRAPRHVRPRRARPGAERPGHERPPHRLAPGPLRRRVVRDRRLRPRGACTRGDG